MFHIVVEIPDNLIPLHNVSIVKIEVLFVGVYQESYSSRTTQSTVTRIGGGGGMRVSAACSEW